MRELDFDVFASQDAGRALYRTVAIFGAFMFYKHQFS